MKIKTQVNSNRALSFYILVASLVVLTSACVENNVTPSSMANPAARKCVEDGFSLKPVIVNGVSTEYRCINPKTFKECEVWEYFRDECSL